MKKNKKPDQKDQSIKALFGLYRYNWKKYTPIFLLAAISNVFLSIVPYFVGQIAGLLSSPTVNTSELVRLVSLMVLANIIHDVTWKIKDWASVRVLTPVNYTVRSIVQKYVWGYEYKDFIEKPSGKIASASEEVYVKMASIYFEFEEEDINNLIKFPFFIGILFISSKANAALFAFFTLILIVVSWLSLKRVIHTANIHADNRSSVVGRVYDSFSNFVNVKSFKSETVETSTLEKDSRSMMDTSIKRTYADMWYWFSAGFVIRWGLWISFAVLNLWLYDNGRLDIAGFVTAITILQQFTNSVWQISGRIKDITTNVTEYRQNYNYLFEGRNIFKEYYHEQKQKKFKVFKPAFRQNLSLTKLNFAYPDRENNLVLKNISLDIKKNEKIGIVGKSGSGKSTLIKLLLGFYDYKEGAIQIDGKNVTKDELGLINSYVPQDTTLFQQSIAYNIAYAKEGRASQKEIIEAAKKAHAHEFIDSLPDKYDTLVGERGIKLSLGQRQRIAIARAFLKHSDLLILDEATSALDSKTEKLVQESLEELWEGKTVIAIAHRLSTLNNVDRIIVMDAGRIVEQGTKTELLSNNGIFADLWQHQKNGLIIDEEEKEL